MMQSHDGRRAMSRLPNKTGKRLLELGTLADKRRVPLYIVGGVVRDLLLKRPTWDLDLTVEGDGIAFAREVADRYGAGLALFERFATARLTFPDSLKVDIASTRRESYAQAAALPDVASASWREDLYRRDFTINAMAIQLNAAHWAELYDPFGGRRDLKARILRVLHVGSFIDDPTRIFRAVRFARRFSFRLETETQRLLEKAANTDLVDRLSGPRLCNEMFLLLNERDCVKTIDRLAELKLLRFLHPRLRWSSRTRQVVNRIPRALGWWQKQSDEPLERPLLYLMALLSEGSPSMLKAISRRLQLSTAQSRSVLWAGAQTNRAAKMLMGTQHLRPSQIYRALTGLSNEALVLVVAKALTAGTASARPRLLRRCTRFVARDRRVTVALNGEDLKRLGLKPGPQFSRILTQTLHARLDGLVETKSAELAFVRRLIARVREVRQG